MKFQSLIRQYSQLIRFTNKHNFDEPIPTNILEKINETKMLIYGYINYTIKDLDSFTNGKAIILKLDLPNIDDERDEIIIELKRGTANLSSQIFITSFLSNCRDIITENMNKPHFIIFFYEIIKMHLFGFSFNFINIDTIIKNIVDNVRSITTHDYIVINCKDKTDMYTCGRAILYNENTDIPTKIIIYNSISDDNDDQDTIYLSSLDGKYTENTGTNYIYNKYIKYKNKYLNIKNSYK